ncbi:Methylenetetrahydrofolate reductase 1 (ZmMTHFR1), partial [Durusdinium trenchii]
QGDGGEEDEKGDETDREKGLCGVMHELAVDTVMGDKQGNELVFCNTYHLMVQPGPDRVAAFGGLHKFMNRKGDVGLKGAGQKQYANLVVKVNEDGATFRSYHNGDLIHVGPETTIQAQKKLGADIIIPLDYLVPYNASADKVSAAFEMTHRWEERSLNEHLANPAGQAIYSVIHGGMDLALRKESVRRLTALDFNGHAVGGSLGKSRDDLIDILRFTLPLLPLDKPNHILGIGDMSSILRAVPLGADTFDSSYPTRLARHGYALRGPDQPARNVTKLAGNRDDQGPLVDRCKCYTCQNYSAGYVHHLIKANEPSAQALMTIHNLAAMQANMASLRQAILEDRQLMLPWNRGGTERNANAKSQKRPRAIDAEGVRRRHVVTPWLISCGKSSKMTGVAEAVAAVTVEEKEGRPAPKIHELVEAKGKETWVAFEYFPPKTETGVANLYKRLGRMQQQGPLYVDFTWGAGGSTSDLTLELSQKAQTEFGCVSNMHLTCTNMPREKLDNALAVAEKVGIRNILALRGDPPLGQEDFKPVESGFSCALDLVKYIREKTGDLFSVSVAGYPEGHPNRIKKVASEESMTPTEVGRAVKMEDGSIHVCSDKDFLEELDYLKAKVDAGAQMIVTQMFYDVNVFLSFVKACRDHGINVPIVPGIMCITSYGGFKRMVGFCKTRVTDEMMAKIESMKEDKEALEKYAVEWGVTTCKTILEAGINGLHFYTLNMDKIVMGVLQGLDLAKPLAEN